MFKIEKHCGNNVDNNRVNEKPISDVENYFQISVFLIFSIRIECRVFIDFDTLFLLFTTNNIFTVQ